MSWGKREDALKAYEQALALDRAAGRNAGIAGDLNNIGLVYKTWGKYDEALKYLEQARPDQRSGSKTGMVVRLNNIGLVYKAQDRYNKALSTILSKPLRSIKNWATWRHRCQSEQYRKHLPDLGQHEKALDHYTCRWNCTARPDKTMKSPCI